MSRITVGQENSTPINLYYEDHGEGRPVILIHGFPLNGASWEKQTGALLAAGHRVIAYDRRGFGRSSQPSTGYDYDTLAADLNKLVKHLGLWEASLVGFAMGSGEVTRYLGTYGSERVRRAVLVSSIPPFLLRAPDNPEGVDQSVFDGITQSIVSDRPAFLSSFLTDFYNVDALEGTRISEDAVRANFNVAASASAKGTLDCVLAWLSDFRQDLPRIDVPTLIIHGGADRILPLASTSARLPALVAGSRLVVVPDGPHGFIWTHPEVVNPVLLGFLE